MPNSLRAATLALTLALVPGAPMAAGGPVLSDLWNGSVVCGKEMADANFTLTRRKDGNFDGMLELLFPNALHGAAYDYTFLGEEIGGGYQFVIPRGGIRSMSSPKLGEFVVTMTANGGLDFVFDGGACSTASLDPASVTPERYTPTATAKQGGIYGAASTARDRCEAIVAWTDRLEREYADLADHKTDAKWMYPRLALLWGDDDFIPLFGRAFDSMTQDEHATLSIQIRKECRSEEFVRKRYGVYGEIISRSFDRDMKNFGSRGIIEVVRDQRELRHRLRAATAPGADISASDAARLATAARDGAALLWPSELEATVATVNAVVQGSAATQFASQMAAIETMSDPLAGLEAIKALRVSSDMANLDTARQGKARGELNAAEARFVAALLAPLEREADAAANDLAGAALIQTMIAGIPGSVKATEAGGATATALRERVDQRVDAYLATERATLEAMPATLAGLEAGAAWREVVDGDLAAFSSEARGEVAKAYEAKRAAQYQDALGEFEASVKGLGSAAEAEALLARYFPTDADMKRSIYLDYAFAAAAWGG